MPASNTNNPQDPLSYLVGGVKNADKRNIRLENERPVSGWITPPLLNGFAAPSSPMTTPQYRYCLNTHALEFRGHLNAAGAVTGTVAFVIIQPMWPSFDISFITDIYDGVTVAVARVFIDSATGNVTVSW